MKLSLPCLFLGVTIFSTHALACANFLGFCGGGEADQCECNGGHLVSLTLTDLISVPALSIVCYLIPCRLVLESMTTRRLLMLILNCYSFLSYLVLSLFFPLYCVLIVPTNLLVVQMTCVPVAGDRLPIRKSRYTPPVASSSHAPKYIQASSLSYKYRSRVPDSKT